MKRKRDMEDRLRAIKSRTSKEAVVAREQEDEARVKAEQQQQGGSELPDFEESEEVQKRKKEAQLLDYLFRGDSDDDDGGGDGRGSGISQVTPAVYAPNGSDNVLHGPPRRPAINPQNLDAEIDALFQSVRRNKR